MKSTEVSVGMLVSLGSSNYLGESYTTQYKQGVIVSPPRPKGDGKSRVYECDVNWGTPDKPVIRTHPTNRLDKVQSKNKAA